jgi:hypothetical protein
MPDFPAYRAISTWYLDYPGHKPSRPLCGRGWDGWNRTRRSLPAATSATVLAIDVADDGTVNLTCREGNEVSRVDGWNHDPEGLRRVLDRSGVRWWSRWRLLEGGKVCFHLADEGPTPCT